MRVMKKQRRLYAKLLRAGLGLVFISVICLMLHATAAYAATSTWASGSNGAWGTGSNWSPAGVPNSASSDVVFPDYGFNPSINIASSFSVHNLSFTNNAGSSYELFGVGSLLVSGSLIVTDHTSGPDINLPLNLQGNVTFDVGVSSVVSLSGADVLTGSGGITLSGGGLISNDGIESYTGPTIISAGTWGSSGGNQFSPNSDFTLADSSSAVLSACGGDQIIGSLSGGGASHVRLCGATITLGNSSDTTYAGTIEDFGNPNGGIIKQGTGKFTLTGTNTYTGPTTVNAGTLDVNGSLAGSTVTVHSGATLKGSGTLPAVTMDGVVAPGNSIGTLHGTSFTFANGSILENEIDASGNTDLINATTSVTINSGATLKVVPAAGTYTDGQTYTIISAPSISGTFSSITSTSNSLTYQLKYFPTHVDLIVAKALAPVTAAASSTEPPATGYGTPGKSEALPTLLFATSLVFVGTGIGLAHKARRDSILR